MKTRFKYKSLEAKNTRPTEMLLSCHPNSVSKTAPPKSIYERNPVARDGTNPDTILNRQSTISLQSAHGKTVIELHETRHRMRRMNAGASAYKRLFSATTGHALAISR
jgi:hypothetical protein